jgi:hypothetical protein
MGFNKRKMEDARQQKAEKEAASRRATDRQILDEAEQLMTAWNERQARRMRMLFSPTMPARPPAPDGGGADLCAVFVAGQPADAQYLRFKLAVQAVEEQSERYGRL